MYISLLSSQKDKFFCQSIVPWRSFSEHYTVHTQLITLRTASFRRQSFLRVSKKFFCSNNVFLMLFSKRLLWKKLYCSLFLGVINLVITAINLRAFPLEISCFFQIYQIFVFVMLASTSNSHFIIRIAVFFTFSVKLFSNYFLFFFFPVGKTIGNISSW